VVVNDDDCDTHDTAVGERDPQNHDPTYTVGTLVFTSPMHLPELVAHPGRPRFVRLRVVTPRRMSDEESSAFLDDDTPDFLVTTRTPMGGVRFLFSRLATFVFEGIGESVSSTVPSTTTDETVRHLLLDHVLPRLMVKEGDVVLHASVVVKDGCAIAFIGPSGAGKSTLATSLAQHGFSILSDDALPLLVEEQRLWTRSMYPGVRLYPANARALVGSDVGESVAHYTDKVRLDARALGDDAFARGRVPLVRLYVLERGDDEVGPLDVRVTPMASKDALRALLACAFRLDVKDDRESMLVFDRLTRPEVLSRCRTLTAPHRHDAVFAVVDAITRDSG
jgi:hypothetical protein